MNRAERRAAQRRKRQWLKGVQRSELSPEVKQLAWHIYNVSDDEGRFSTDDDGEQITFHRGWPA